jgi:XTP/dITP diphosphohydrolase
VPHKLPALQRAHRLQEKAAKVGFDWEKKEDVWKKVIEEIKEMHDVENLKSQTSDLNTKKELNLKLEKEVGDVFFAIVNYARFLGINPEDALRLTNEKFIKRFNYVQMKVKETGKAINESNLEEMDKYWNESKKLNGYD